MMNNLRSASERGGAQATPPTPRLAPHSQASDSQAAEEQRQELPGGAEDQHPAPASSDGPVALDEGDLQSSQDAQAMRQAEERAFFAARNLDEAQGSSLVAPQAATAQGRAAKGDQSADGKQAPALAAARPSSRNVVHWLRTRESNAPRSKNANAALALGNHLVARRLLESKGACGLRPTDSQEVSGLFWVDSIDDKSARAVLQRSWFDSFDIGTLTEAGVRSVGLHEYEVDLRAGTLEVVPRDPSSEDGLPRASLMSASEDELFEVLASLSPPEDDEDPGQLPALTPP